MADICKCARKDCPLSKTCFRFLAEDSLYQSYFIIEELPEKCNEYWPCKTKKELDRLNRLWREP